MSRSTTSRRRFLAMSVAVPATLALGRATASRAQPLRATPACGDGPTPRQTEGPYFRPESPERVSLVERGTTASRMVVSGRVVTTDCRPVPRALGDVWHCDEHGEYDNTGNRYRGHQLTDAEGRYRFETIVPGLYPGRTRHFHVKVQAPNQRVLTTQLYVPGEPENARDGIFNPALVLNVRDVGAARHGTFDFVVETA